MLFFLFLESLLIPSYPIIYFNLDIELIISNYFTSVSCTCIKYQQGNKYKYPIIHYICNFRIHTQFRKPEETKVFLFIITFT